MKEPELIPHLFRNEFTRIVSVLCRSFGLAHIELAEDIASETFQTALETWTYKGLPENPTAWLYAVAKNKTRNFIARHKTFSNSIAASIKRDSPSTYDIEIDLSETNITDSQLRMLFALCHPSISEESQIGLSLRVLCGFGIEEIASALLINSETINKRLFRAREKLRAENVLMEFPALDQVRERLETVLTTLYLLFSEGYYSDSGDSVLREDLCLESMRLTHLLIENPATNLPAVNALFAMMCFHASRFPARADGKNSMVLYDEQDTTRWNYDLIAKGAEYLHRSATHDTVTPYHMEAGIAYWHTVKASEEKWENILHLYNQLLSIRYSPIAALNRTYAVSRVKGNAIAIAEAEKLDLHDNRFYFALLGELYTTVNPVKARHNFACALQLAKAGADKAILQDRIRRLEEG